MEPTKVAKYIHVLKTVPTEKCLLNKPHQIWNMDETGVQLDHKPGKIVAAKGSKYLQTRTSGHRETITLIGASNAAGSSLPPHIITKHMECFRQTV